MSLILVVSNIFESVSESKQENADSCVPSLPKFVSYIVGTVCGYS